MESCKQTSLPTKAARALSKMAPFQAQPTPRGQDRLRPARRGKPTQDLTLLQDFLLSFLRGAFQKGSGPFTSRPKMGKEYGGGGGGRSVTLQAAAFWHTHAHTSLSPTGTARRYRGCQVYLRKRVAYLARLVDASVPSQSRMAGPPYEKHPSASRRRRPHFGLYTPQYRNSVYARRDRRLIAQSAKKVLTNVASRRWLERTMPRRDRPNR
ncbi:uncharacterized protein LY79DRAFT_363202 [Colletotrichum navitas]|uniref:Uncharacterized protein n=1 Tax=Colletotrichum navitas TaxID=681940 RepID=A0AAD8V0E8_9PEZI|nr:uncharacterized protein LY79DRAFT_363202 [Colletotrichum navitas]KAK1574707.1 hypothetical protein LY79DRAFT_363202 [Colletotrichum navitas]